MRSQTVLSPAPKLKASRSKPRQMPAVIPDNTSRATVIPDNTLASASTVDLVPGTIMHLPPVMLSVHPDLMDVAALSFDERTRLQMSIREAGRVIQPLIITPRREILDGRNRNAIALEENLPTVPVLIDDRADAVAIALSSALDRRQLDEGQRALYVFKLHRGIRQEWQGKQRDGQLRGEEVSAKFIECSLDSYARMSFREIGARYGVNYPYLSLLNQMWNNSTDEEWEEIVRMIESGESTLKQQYKGFQSRLLTKDKPLLKNPDRQIERCTSGFLCVGRHWSSYEAKVQLAHEKEMMAALPSVDPVYIARMHKIFGEHLAKLEEAAR